MSSFSNGKQQVLEDQKRVVSSPALPGLSGRVASKIGVGIRAREINCEYK